MASVGSSYWCYRCNQFVRVRIGADETLLCPDCGSGFIEEIRTRTHSPFHRFPSPSIYVDDESSLEQGASPRIRRGPRNAGDRSPFNPVIVLSGPADGGGGGNEGVGIERGNFELYYNEGTGSGLRPLPASVTEFLMGAGFDHLLDQLTHLEVTGIGRLHQTPASKSAIESMPIVKIVATHVSAESHCAVCKEPFELDSDAREMPCKHIYHSDCILPWLSIRNSCPVCRHELPTEMRGSSSGRNSPVSNGGRDDHTVGLTIWRLPGGGFAVGRFTGGRRAAERELPVVYTEMDGGFNSVGVPRRISWETSVRRSRETRGLGSAFRNFFSHFGWLRTSFSRSSSTDSNVSRRTRSNTILSRFSRRRN
ncbi:E3 ubiquitin-protein ligase RDUF1-like [Prosopis cineraria]|uniref:E3 ubiquitin-protein ligase RDUF1-like n=1 Tax=Prosopis cineraria TaxID=364024 RepID=UPI0024105FCB|nr:E3 ubiquitin-protein ligase RDUF1-like [Prosopis cineraria]